MTTTPDPWRVLLAVAPPLLEELLSEQLSRADLRISTLASMDRRCDQPCFDVGVLDHALPAWVHTDRCLRVQVSREDNATPSEPDTSESVIDDVEGLRHALAGLCPRRSISIQNN